MWDAGGYPARGSPDVFEREPMPEADSFGAQGGLNSDFEAGVQDAGSHSQNEGFDFGALDQATGGLDADSSATATGSFEGVAADGSNDEQILVDAAVEHAAEAAQFESKAMEHDRGGEAKEAIESYLLAAEKLKQAASLCPEGLPDKAVLSRHAGEVLGRVVYLESLGGAPATAPLEQHIGRVTLTLGGAAEPSDEEEAEAMGFATIHESDGVIMTDSEEGRPTSLKKRAASAAAVVGGTGLLVLHAPLIAAGMAGAVAYAATREDSTGRAARKVGDVGISTANRASSFAVEYRIPDRMNQVVGKVVSDKNQEQAASALESLKSFNRQHQVTKNIGVGASAAASGVGSAASSLSSWVSNAMKKQ